jgi:hypothetical protein
MNVLSSSDPFSRALSALSLGAGIGDDLLYNMPSEQQPVVIMPHSPEYETMEGSLGHTTQELPAMESDNEGNLEIDKGAGAAADNKRAE